MAGIDSYTKLMLHCNGADASTTFTDSSTSAHTVTANGNAQIDTAQSVFGGASGLFDGDADYLSIPDSDDFYYGTGDSTIDFRVRFASLPSAGNYMFIYNQRVDANNVIEFSLYNDSGTYKWSFNTYLSSALKAAITRDTSISTDTWYHIAFVKNVSNLMLFQAGTKLGVNEVDADEIPNIAADVNIGRWSGGGYYLHGWIDEFRVSNGIARWTENFTPPTEAYSDLEESMSDTAILSDVVDGDSWTRGVSDTATLSDAISAITDATKSTSETATFSDSMEPDHLMEPIIDYATISDEIVAGDMIRRKIKFPNLQGKHLGLKFTSNDDGPFAIYYLRHQMRRTAALSNARLNPNTQGQHIGLKIQSTGDDALSLHYLSMEMRRVE